MIYSNKKGFTLIELLVVISIIGLLSSTSLVAFQRVKNKAVHAKYAINMRYLNTALEMYRIDHGDWPAVPGDGRMVISNAPNNGYDVFYNAIAPYMPAFRIDFPYAIGANGIISQGFIFFRGTDQNPVQETMYNSANGQYIGCIKVYNGYFMDLMVPYEQSSFTLNDGGVDPDGIDYLGGNYTVNPNIPAASCPVSSTVM
jgi:prepilin-type N-terminal cleavage/methylation domain-containing protein